MSRSHWVSDHEGTYGDGGDETVANRPCCDERSNDARVRLQTLEFSQLPVKIRECNRTSETSNHGSYSKLESERKFCRQTGLGPSDHPHTLRSQDSIDEWRSPPFD